MRLTEKNFVAALVSTVQNQIDELFQKHPTFLRPSIESEFRQVAN